MQFKVKGQRSNSLINKIINSYLEQQHQDTVLFGELFFLGQMTLEEFWPQFLHHLKFNMIVFKREPAVERTIEFVARFATCLAGVTEDKEKRDETKNQDEDDEEDFEMHPLLTKLFDFLLQVSLLELGFC